VAIDLSTVDQVIYRDNVGAFLVNAAQSADPARFDYFDRLILTKNFRHDTSPGYLSAQRMCQMIC
jgi:hypothetical protein